MVTTGQDRRRKLTQDLIDGAARVSSATTTRLQRASSRYARKVAPSAAPSPGAADPGITWFHSLDLGGGRVTTGIKASDQLAAEVAALNVPARLTGKSVLDIGAWDGYFSFEAERRGAKRIVALDHYAWSINWAAWHDYYVDALQKEVSPLPPDEVASVWDPHGLPGRAGFDHARAELGSKVEPVVGDFMTMDLSKLGTFDVVFFLGVLYHLKDPFAALRRLRDVTKELAVIETAGTVVPGLTDERLWMFVEGAELNGDPSNWWAPTAAGLTGACRAAGFRDTRVILEPPEHSAPAGAAALHYGRITVHAYA